MAYAERRYSLSALLSRVTDSRRRPLIPTAVISGAAFIMALARMGSLHALEQDKRLPFWRRWLGAPLASADTIGRVFTKMRSDDWRGLLHSVYDRLRRNKALGMIHGHTVLILDGHESSASYLRCCGGCLEREVSEGRRQYYHRLVLAMLSGDRFPLLLDAEPQRPGEDEVGCGLRLLRRVMKDYPRAFDLVLADGLYLQAPLVSFVRRNKKHVILVLKDERRDLLQDARGIFQAQAPTERTEGRLTYRIWDVEDLTSWPALGEPVRVVRSLETRTVVRQRDHRQERVESEWIWMTTLPQAKATASIVVRLGHNRWWIENRGYRELVTFWHADHVYRHDPQAIVAFWLLVMLVLNLFRAFLNLNIKLGLRSRHSQIWFAQKIAAALFAEGSSP